MYVSVNEVALAALVIFFVSFYLSFLVKIRSLQESEETLMQ